MQKGKNLLNLLYKNGKLKRLYKTKERISKIISRAFNVYINVLSEKKKISHGNRERFCARSKDHKVGERSLLSSKITKI